MKKKKNFQVFVWNEKIHTSFTILLVVTVFLLATVGYVQSVKINSLSTKLSERPSLNEELSYEYDIVTLRDFFKGEEVPESLAVMNSYLQRNGYSKIYITKGFIEGEIVKNCEVDGRKIICDYELVRFNQKKGKYIEVITRQIERE
jgi:hypothetical protein